ncbi:MAG: vanomycin resistance protein VanB, partial [Ruminiclostridium sp.]|nr:vanomycin resistance protein VanB [Ruminiclostridium sp.]
YREAPVIFKSELIPGTGGGICQVTTTLYNTVLKAKLDVLERSPHSMPLGYVQPGQDATIAEGVIDFRFRNNRGYPVYISAFVKGNTIRIQILGKSEPVKKIVKLRSVVLETIPPGADEIEIDDSLPDGEKVVVNKSRNGVRSILYRETFSESNVLLDREVISKDYYKPVRGHIKINNNYKTFLLLEGYMNE